MQKKTKAHLKEDVISLFVAVFIMSLLVMSTNGHSAIVIYSHVGNVIEYMADPNTFSFLPSDEKVINGTCLDVDILSNTSFVNYGVTGQAPILSIGYKNLTVDCNSPTADVRALSIQDPTIPSANNEGYEFLIRGTAFLPVNSNYNNGGSPMNGCYTVSSSNPQTRVNLNVYPNFFNSTYGCGIFNNITSDLANYYCGWGTPGKTRFTAEAVTLQYPYEWNRYLIVGGMSSNINYAACGVGVSSEGHYFTIANYGFTDSFSPIFPLIRYTNQTMWPYWNSSADWPSQELYDVNNQPHHIDLGLASIQSQGYQTITSFNTIDFGISVFNNIPGTNVNNVDIWATGAQGMTNDYSTYQNDMFSYFHNGAFTITTSDPAYNLNGANCNLVSYTTNHWANINLPIAGIPFYDTYCFNLSAYSYHGNIYNPNNKQIYGMIQYNHVPGATNHDLNFYIGRITDLYFNITDITVMPPNPTIANDVIIGWATTVKVNSSRIFYQINLQNSGLGPVLTKEAYNPTLGFNGTSWFVDFNHAEFSSNEVIQFYVQATLNNLSLNSSWINFTVSNTNIGNPLNVTILTPTSGIAQVFGLSAQDAIYLFGTFLLIAITAMAMFFVDFKFGIAAFIITGLGFSSIGYLPVYVIITYIIVTGITVAYMLRKVFSPNISGN